MSLLTKAKAPELARTKTKALRQVVCWGSTGAGKSSFAVNLACELTDLGHTVLLIDADSYHPSLAALLGITNPGPGITAVLRLVRIGRFSLAELERLGHEVKLGERSFWLLSGMTSPNRWSELDAPSLAQLPNLLESQFEFVIWDVASYLEKSVVGAEHGDERNQASNFLVSTANSVFSLFSADPIGINRFLFDCRDVGRDFTAVANRIRSSVLGRQAERQVRDLVYELARIRVEYAIAEDPGFDELLRSLRPLALQAKGSKARETIRQIAQDLAQS